MDYTKQIQEIATRLFSEGKIDVFIGYKRTGFDDNQVPVLITRPEQAGPSWYSTKSRFSTLSTT